MKSQIGNTLCFISLFLIFSLYGCRTVKNSVTKEKTLTEKSELNIEKFDSISKIDKNKQNKSVGLSFNITIIIAIGVIIVSCLFWKFGLPKFNR